MTDRNIPTELVSTSELLALARFQRIDSRNGSEAAKDQLLGIMADEIEHLAKARDRDHEQAWMNGAAALRYRRALEAIAAFDPGKFRPLADEIAIWKQATDALQDDVSPTTTEKTK